jgi:hypothetical protein
MDIMIFMASESIPNDQTSPFKNIEFAVNPGDEGGWYWEVIQGREAILRGMAETEPAACEQARAEARKANLVP